MVIREARKLVRNYKSPFIKMHHIFNSLVSDFNAINFLHILRTNNHFAYQMANKWVQLDFGYIICNGNNLDHCWFPWFRSIFFIHIHKKTDPMLYSKFRTATNKFLMFSFCILILGKFVRIYSHFRLGLFQDKLHFVTEEQHVMVFESLWIQSIILPL